MESLLNRACKKRKRSTQTEISLGDSPRELRGNVPAPDLLKAFEIVKLNVGGHEYVTSLSTLRRVEGSMLARMFESEIPSATTGGAFFLDRDGELFAFILSYLRDGTVELPKSRTKLRQLEREAGFFLLPGLQHMLRSKLSEVHLEVKLFAESFGCTEEHCKCGCNRLAHPEAFSDLELEAMDCADLEWMGHPSSSLRPEFKVPVSIHRVCLQAFVPGNASDGCVRVHCHYNPKCLGEYMSCGFFNGHKLYKNNDGAHIFYKDGKWRINIDEATDAWIMSSQNDVSSDTPPTGLWFGSDAGMCLVDGEEVAQPEGSSLQKAIQMVKSQLRETCCQERSALTDMQQEIEDVLRAFIKSPDLSYRQLYFQAGKYEVGERYDPRTQRKHFSTAIKMELKVLHTS